MFGEYDEVMSLPWRVQSQIRKAFESIAESEEQNAERRATACYYLSIFYIQRIGTLEQRNPQDPWDGYRGYSPDFEVSMKWLRRAAELGSSIARANYSRLASAYSVHNVEDLVPLKEVKRWLEVGTKEGSLIAAEELQNLDIDAWKRADESLRREFCGLGRRLFEPTTVDYPPDMPMFTEYLSTKWVTPTSLVLNERGDTVLHWAAMTGRFAELVHICNMDMAMAYLNSLNMTNETPLLQACRSGHDLIVRELLKRGADATICTSNGENCLHWLGSFRMEEKNLLSISKALVLAGAKIEQVCKTNAQYNPTFRSQVFAGTPLQRATVNRDTRVVKVLLDVGADPYFGSTAESESPVSAIDLACSYHDMEILSLFLPPRFPIKHPRWYKNQQVFSLRKIWEMFRQDFTGDSSASLLGFTLRPQHLYRRMLRHGSHFDTNMRSIISRLIHEGESVYRVDYKNCSALLFAVWGRDFSIVSFLLESFPDLFTPLLKYPTPNGLAMNLPIHASIALSDRPMFEKLLEYFPMQTPVTVPEELSDWGSNIYRAGLEVKASTLANHPVSTQFCSIVHLMAKSITDVCFANQLLQSLPEEDLQNMIRLSGTYGDFPLQLAIISHSFEVASLLIAQGADINQETGSGQCKGWTPLGAALVFNNDGSPEAISWLLRNGASFIVSQETQTSAIQIAVRSPTAPRTRQSDSIADGLLKFLQRPDTKNLELILDQFHTQEHLDHQDTHFGYTAMHWAVNSLDTAAVKLLLERGASLEITATDGPAKGLSPLALALGIHKQGVPTEVSKRGSKVTRKYLDKVCEILAILGLVED
jgi:ankyrin repeat protein